MKTTRSPKRARRTEALLVRLSPAEIRTIRERARACGKGASTYMRETALGSVPRARPQLVEKELIYHLSRIGSNVNQIARFVNTTGRLDMARELDRVLGKLTTVLEKLA